VGRRYGLEIDNPVGGDGRFLPSTPLFAGEQVFDANAHVIKVLHENGRLLRDEPYHHSYPHCWRHKTPVIFRATPQWFISMEQAGLRKGALEAIAHVDWMPGWGEQRISGMIAGRPDWCVSRQRTWGVPLPLFVDKVSGELHPRTAELIEDVAKRVEKTASMPGSIWMRGVAGSRRGLVRQGHRRDGCVVRFRRGASLRIADAAGNQGAERSVPRRLGSAPRLVSQLAADLGGHAWPRSVSRRADAWFHRR
jgi:valyl-tRNA synthetase